MTTLSKRAYDRRILHVDLRRALRAGDRPVSVVSVVAQGDGDDLNITDISLDGTVVSFLAAGGTAGQSYRLVIRVDVDSSPRQMIEAIVSLNVG